MTFMTLLYDKVYRVLVRFYQKLEEYCFSILNNCQVEPFTENKDFNQQVLRILELLSDQIKCREYQLRMIVLRL